VTAKVWVTHTGDGVCVSLAQRVMAASDHCGRLCHNDMARAETNRCEPNLAAADEHNTMTTTVHVRFACCPSSISSSQAYLTLVPQMPYYERFVCSRAISSPETINTRCALGQRIRYRHQYEGAACSSHTCPNTLLQLAHGRVCVVADRATSCASPPASQAL
jgi:hypothetical protein